LAFDDGVAAADAMLVYQGGDGADRGGGGGDEEGTTNEDEVEAEEDGDGDANGSALATTPAAPDWTMGCVPVEALSIVLFQCRSLERILSEQVIQLNGEATHGAPLAPERKAVAQVLAEFTGPEVWPY